MKMESFPTCMICGLTGRAEYTDLPDRLFGVPGRFQSRECPHCRLLWIDPRPSPESIAECYRDYYTHEELPSGGEQARPLAVLRDRLREAILCGYFGYRHLHRDHRLCRYGGLLGRIPLLRYRAVYDDLATASPLCGSKGQSAHRCGLWQGGFSRPHEDPGVERSGHRARPRLGCAGPRRQGIPVFCGSLEKRPTRRHGPTRSAESRTGACTRPAQLLRNATECCDPVDDSSLYLPNIESLGHRFFGETLGGLDPPRHLFHFSPRSTSMGCCGKALFGAAGSGPVGNDQGTGIYDYEPGDRENNLKSRTRNRSTEEGSVGFQDDRTDFSVQRDSPAGRKSRSWPSSDMPRGCSGPSRAP